MRRVRRDLPRPAARCSGPPAPPTPGRSTCRTSPPAGAAGRRTAACCWSTTCPPAGGGDEAAEGDLTCVAHYSNTLPLRYFLCYLVAHIYLLLLLLPKLPWKRAVWTHAVSEQADARYGVHDQVERSGGWLLPYTFVSFLRLRSGSLGYLMLRLRSRLPKPKPFLYKDDRGHMGLGTARPYCRVFSFP